METMAPAAASARTTGNHAAQFLLDGDRARRRGRVDSPPISRMSAPASRSARPWAMAAVGIGEIAAVGEAVGRHIDHAHDARPVERKPGERPARALVSRARAASKVVGQAAPRRPGARLGRRAAEPARPPSRSRKALKARGRRPAAGPCRGDGARARPGPAADASGRKAKAPPRGGALAVIGHRSPRIQPPG